MGVKKSIRPVKLSDEVSGARCRLFAYGPADATAIPKPHPDWFYLSGTGLPGCSGKEAIKRV